MLRLLALVGVLFLGEAANAQGQDPGIFGNTALEQAKDMLGDMGHGLGTTTVTQDKSKSPYFAQFDHDDNQVTLYPSTFLAHFSDLRIAGLNGSYAAGLIVGSILHELIHKCLGPADNALEEACRNAYGSC